jgi:hypothetical protein
LRADLSPVFGPHGESYGESYGESHQGAQSPVSTAVSLLSADASPGSGFNPCADVDLQVGFQAVARSKESESICSARANAAFLASVGFVHMHDACMTV